MSTTDEAQEREAFEKWCKDAYVYFERRANGYLTVDAQNYWECWQAARASVPSSVGVTVKSKDGYAGKSLGPQVRDINDTWSAMRVLQDAITASKGTKEDADRRKAFKALEACLVPASQPAQEVVAWLHTMHMEAGQTNDRLTFDDENPFGMPGQDYSGEYSVTSSPLYDAPSAPPASVDAVKVVREAVEKSVWGRLVPDWLQELALLGARAALKAAGITDSSQGEG